jgi:multiple sugar transport system permease protein
LDNRAKRSASPSAVVTEAEAYSLGRKPTIWEVLSSEKYFKWTLLIPLLLILTVFMLYPLFFCLYQSFHTGGVVGTPTFVGLTNYVELLHDPDFWVGLRRTAEVVVICLIAELLIGMGIALLWNRDFKGQNVVRGLTLLPLLVAPLILSLVWNFLLEYNIGLVNQVLSELGLGRVKWWWPDMALFTICGITIWQWFPFSTFVLLAGLRGLPKDVFEAAKVDGASAWYTFRRLTLPMLSPLIIIIALLRTMWLIRLFDPLYGTTRGGVNTELLDWTLYRTAFVYFDVGYGSAMAIVSLYLTIILCAILFRLLIRALGATK